MQAGGAQAIGASQGAKDELVTSGDDLALLGSAMAAPMHSEESVYSLILTIYI